MNRPIYTMTDAELQAENDRLRRENDRLCKALADMAEENAELRANGALKNSFKISSIVRANTGDTPSSARLLLEVTT